MQSTLSGTTMQTVHLTLSPYLPRGASAAADNTASGVVGSIVGGLLRG